LVDALSYTGCGEIEANDLEQSATDHGVSLRLGYLHKGVQILKSKGEQWNKKESPQGDRGIGQGLGRACAIIFLPAPLLSEPMLKTKSVWTAIDRKADALRLRA
jgi:hypothetical protein